MRWLSAVGVVSAALSFAACGAGGADEHSSQAISPCVRSFNQFSRTAPSSVLSARMGLAGATAYVATWGGAPTSFRPHGACLLAVADQSGVGSLFSEATIPGEGRTWIPVSEPIPGAPPSGLELDKQVQLAMIRLAHRSPNVEVDATNAQLTPADASPGPTTMDLATARQILDESETSAATTTSTEDATSCPDVSAATMIGVINGTCDDATTVLAAMDRTNNYNNDVRGYDCSLMFSGNVGTTTCRKGSMTITFQVAGGARD